MCFVVNGLWFVVRPSQELGNHESHERTRKRAKHFFLLVPKHWNREGHEEPEEAQGAMVLTLQSFVLFVYFVVNGLWFVVRAN